MRCEPASCPLTRALRTSHLLLPGPDTRRGTERWAAALRRLCGRRSELRADPAVRGERGDQASSRPVSATLFAGAPAPQSVPSALPCAELVSPCVSTAASTPRCCSFSFTATEMRCKLRFTFKLLKISG